MPDERSSPMATTAAVSQNILFSEAKKELFSPSSGYRSLQARLKAHWSVGVIRDEITLEKVGGARMVVFGCPRDKFSVAEFTALRSYLEGGGNVMVMLGEGGETELGTNVNFLLEEFGIALNNGSYNTYIGTGTQFQHVLERGVPLCLHCSCLALIFPPRLSHENGVPQVPPPKGGSGD
jgi:hypothetical protein